MTNEEADGIIRAARRKKVPLPRDDHFSDELHKDDLSIQDAHNVLDHGKITRIDPSDEEDEVGPICHTVRVEGRALDGRSAAVVVLINRIELCILLTVFDLDR